MKVTLFDFQKDALGKLRDALVSARKSVSPDNQQVVAQDVREVAGKANPGLQVVQLYRDYLLNFMINKNQDRAAGHTDTQGAPA